MKIITMSRGAGKTKMQIERLARFPDEVLVVSTGLVKRDLVNQVHNSIGSRIFSVLEVKEGILQGRKCSGVNIDELADCLLMFCGHEAKQITVDDFSLVEH